MRAASLQSVTARPWPSGAQTCASGVMNCSPWRASSSVRISAGSIAARCASVGQRNPGRSSVVRAEPPTRSARSSTNGLRPAFASSAAATRPLWPPPITIASRMLDTVVLRSAFSVLAFSVLRSPFAVLPFAVRRSRSRSRSFAFGVHLRAKAWATGVGTGNVAGFVRDLERMVARTFEELEAWRLADALKKEVYRLIATGPASRDFAFCTQIRAIRRVDSQKYCRRLRSLPSPAVCSIRRDRHRVCHGDSRRLEGRRRSRPLRRGRRCPRHRPCQTHYSGVDTTGRVSEARSRGRTWQEAKAQCENGERRTDERRTQNAERRT